MDPDVVGSNPTSSTMEKTKKLDSSDNDELLMHEALHCTSIVQRFFERELVKHLAILKNEELSEAADKVNTALADFYQLVGNKRFALNKI